jgi:hypothetical protein
MARRNLAQEAFRRKHHAALVKRSVQKPRGVMPKHGSTKKALHSKASSYVGYSTSSARILSTVD